VDPRESVFNGHSQDVVIRIEIRTEDRRTRSRLFARERRGIHDTGSIVRSSIAVWVRPIIWAGVSKIDKNGRRFSKLTREHFRRKVIFVG
jgi:hypothetical protein